MKNIYKGAVMLAAVALLTSGTAVASDLIGSNDIKDDSVRSIDVRDHTIKKRDLRPALFNYLAKDEVGAGGGQDGTDGKDGAPGAQGPAGTNGTNGTNGKDGTDGVSGYGYMAPAWPAGHAYNPDGIYGTGPVTINGTGKVTVLCPTGKSLISAGAYAGNDIVTNSVRPVKVTGDGPFYVGGADIYVTTTKAVSVQPWAICAAVN
jgi:hypothetical protein